MNFAFMFRYCLSLKPFGWLISVCSERRCSKLDSSPDVPANHKMALFCLLRRCNVLFAIKQHMPPPLLPLRAPFLHNAQTWLCRHRGPHLHLLLPSCLLLIYVQPILLQALLGLYNNIWDCHHYFLSPSSFPESWVSHFSCFSLLWDGCVRCSSYTS